MKTDKQKIWIILIAVAVLLLAAGGIYTLTRGKNTETDSKKETLAVDPNAGQYTAPETEAADSSGIAIPGWESITIPAGETEITVDFPNPEANADKYYLTFELRLKDSGEVLCTTGLVPPGQTIQTVTLSHALDAGEYAAVVHVQPYRMDENQTATNNADMETILIVQ